MGLLFVVQALDATSDTEQLLTLKGDCIEPRGWSTTLFSWTGALGGRIQLQHQHMAFTNTDIKTGKTETRGAVLAFPEFKVDIAASEALLVSYRYVLGPDDKCPDPGDDRPTVTIRVRGRLRQEDTKQNPPLRFSANENCDYGCRRCYSPLQRAMIQGPLSGGQVSMEFDSTGVFLFVTDINIQTVLNVGSSFSASNFTEGTPDACINQLAGELSTAECVAQDSGSCADKTSHLGHYTGPCCRLNHRVCSCRGSQHVRPVFVAPHLARPTV